MAAGAKNQNHQIFHIWTSWGSPFLLLLIRLSNDSVRESTISLTQWHKVAADDRINNLCLGLRRILKKHLKNPHSRITGCIFLGGCQVQRPFGPVPPFLPPRSPAGCTGRLPGGTKSDDGSHHCRHPSHGRTHPEGPPEWVVQNERRQEPPNDPTNHNATGSNGEIQPISSPPEHGPHSLLAAHPGLPVCAGRTSACGRFAPGCG